MQAINFANLPVELTVQIFKELDDDQPSFYALALTCTRLWEISQNREYPFRALVPSFLAASSKPTQELLELADRVQDSLGDQFMSPLFSLERPNALFTAVVEGFFIVAENRLLKINKIGTYEIKDVPIQFSLSGMIGIEGKTPLLALFSESNKATYVLNLKEIWEGEKYFKYYYISHTSSLSLSNIKEGQIDLTSLHIVCRSYKHFFAVAYTNRVLLFDCSQSAFNPVFIQLENVKQIEITDSHIFLLTEKGITSYQFPLLDNPVFIEETNIGFFRVFGDEVAIARKKIDISEELAGEIKNWKTGVTIREFGRSVICSLAFQGIRLLSCQAIGPTHGILKDNFNVIDLLSDSFRIFLVGTSIIVASPNTINIYKKTIEYQKVASYPAEKGGAYSSVSLDGPYLVTLLQLPKTKKISIYHLGEKLPVISQ